MYLLFFDLTQYFRFILGHLKQTACISQGFPFYKRAKRCLAIIKLVTNQ